MSSMEELLDDIDDASVPFVGHETLKETIKEVVRDRSASRCRLIHLLGPAMIGKSRLAEQILTELKHESGGSYFKTRFIVLRGHDRIEPIYLELMSLFGIEQFIDSTFSSSLRELFRRDKISRYLLIFDGVESLMTTSALINEFYELVYQLYQTSEKITMLTTSSVKLTLSPKQILNQSIVNVPVLTAESSEILLKKIAPSLQLSPEKRSLLCKRCHYLPFLIIFIAYLLKRNAMLMVEHVTDALDHESFEAFEDRLMADDDRPFKIISRLISRLGVELGQLAGIMSYFPGDFSKAAATYVAGFETDEEALSRALTPLTRNTVLDLNVNRRYFMHSFLREYLSNKYDYNLTATRQRFAYFFGEMIISVDNQLNKKSPLLALNDIAEEWPNVEKVLKEAIHCNDSELYDHYMTVVREAETFIHRYMPHRGTEFFKALVEYAIMFNKDEDLGMLLVNYSNALANTTDTFKMMNHEDVLDQMEKARKKMIELKCGGYHLKKILMGMGYEYFRMRKLNLAAK